MYYFKHYVTLLTATGSHSHKPYYCADGDCSGLSTLCCRLFKYSNNSRRSNDFVAKLAKLAKLAKAACWLRLVL